MRACGLVALLLAAPVLAGDAPPRTQETPAVPASLPLAVDFANASSADALADWRPDLHAGVRVEEGTLRLRGTGERYGWYSDSAGPLLFATAEGDFVAETAVAVARTDGAAGPPTGRFVSAGLLVRDPASARKNQRWIMYNIGQQRQFYGREAKTTRPSTGGLHVQMLAGLHSRSTLYLTPQRFSEGMTRLRVCRIGPELRFFSRAPDQAEWVEETVRPDTTVEGNGAGEPTPGVESGRLRFLRPDLPPAVQVGLIANRGLNRQDGEGRFSRFEVRPLGSFDECGR